MHQDLERAKEAMIFEGYTCVITLDNIMFKSKDKGLQPLLDWLYSGNKYAGWRLCDKVVGKCRIKREVTNAAAFQQLNQLFSHCLSFLRPSLHRSWGSRVVVYCN